MAINGEVYGKNNTCSVIPPLKKTDENYAFDADEKVTVFNDYFCSISSIDVNIALPYFGNVYEISLANIIITDSEVTDILSNLKVNKASGPDGICHRMLKYTCKTVAKPLCRLFNMSLQQRSFPNLWKSADVMPIFKKGDKRLLVTIGHCVENKNSNYTNDIDKIIPLHHPLPKVEG